MSDSATTWTAAIQASLSLTISQSLFKLISIESVMPSNHLILCCSLLLLPSVFSSIRVFCSESGLHIRWPKYWSFSFSISPSDEYSGLISLRMCWITHTNPEFSKFRIASCTLVLLILSPRVQGHSLAKFWCLCTWIHIWHQLSHCFRKETDPATDCMRRLSMEV